MRARRRARPLLRRIHVDQQLHRDRDRIGAARRGQALAAARAAMVRRYDLSRRAARRALRLRFLLGAARTRALVAATSRASATATCWRRKSSASARTRSSNSQPPTHRLRGQAGAGRPEAQDAFPRLSSARKARCRSARPSTPSLVDRSATRPSRASPTSSPTASCSSSSAPGRTRADRPVTTARDDDRFVRLSSARSPASGRDAFRGATASRTSPSCSFAGLIGSRIKSASRLRQLMRRHLPGRRRHRGARRQLAGLRAVRPDVARCPPCRPRRRTPYLGDARLLDQRQDPHPDQGATSLEQYRQFLPAGDLSEQLTDLDLLSTLAIASNSTWNWRCRRASSARAARRIGRAGLDVVDAHRTTTPAGQDAICDDARFNPMERRGNVRRPRKQLGNSRGRSP